MVDVPEPNEGLIVHLYFKERHIKGGEAGKKTMPIRTQYSDRLSQE